ncbi:ADP-ribosylglycohydrolase family protein [Synechococcus sp. AH-601-B19]|nr:ADP-ribosylglycohydrolase family protein [Synechococcus sp. AH-601-B19]
MASFYIDLDGVFFKYQTLELTDGALDFIKDLKRQGNQIIFTTARKTINNNRPNIAIMPTIKRLDQLGVEYDHIIKEVSSPRIIINDEGCYAINHVKDRPLILKHITPPGGFQKDCHATDGSTKKINQIQSIDESIEKSKVARKIKDALFVSAWTAYRYAGDDLIDADDYVQTIIICKSLIKNCGFDHEELVTRLRTKPGYMTPNGRELMAGGTSSKYLNNPDPPIKGSIWLLNQSQEKKYIAKGGFTDGAAMRVAGISAFYRKDLESMIKITDNISRITHSYPDARLAAILVALRFYDIFNFKNSDPSSLVESLIKASELIGFGDEAQFFINKCKKASAISSDKNLNPEQCFIKLLKHVGMNKLAWSTPISATFWSFHNDVDFKKYLSSPQERWNNGKEMRGFILSDSKGHKRIYDYSETDESVHIEDKNRIRHLISSEGIYPNVPDEIVTNNFPRRLDIDTFCNISFSLLSAKNGLRDLRNEARLTCKNIFNDNIHNISKELLSSYIK